MPVKLKPRVDERDDRESRALTEPLCEGDVVCETEGVHSRVITELPGTSVAWTCGMCDICDGRERVRRWVV